jgi:hypothetical protein
VRKALRMSQTSPFFSQVFKYRQTEARSPREDFLSEILAKYLNCVPKNLVWRIIEKSFVPLQLQHGFEELTRGARCEIKTQLRIKSRKILDLVIFSNDQPFIVIESKIFAQFQKHWQVVEQIDNNATDIINIEYDHQLATYGKWLRDANKLTEWPGVVVLLTHGVSAPDDFIYGNLQGYGAVPQHSTWRDLHANILNMLGPITSPAIEPAWKFIGWELCQFLEDQNMGSMDLTSVEIAALNISMGPSRKAIEAFVEISDELWRRKLGLLQNKKRSTALEVGDSRIWSWIYFDDPQRIYLAFGVYFSPVVGNMTTSIPPLPDQEHAFIAVGSDSSTRSGTLPEDWHNVAGDQYVVKPIALNCRLTAERFPNFMLRIVEENWEVIEAVKKQYAIEVAPL